MHTFEAALAVERTVNGVSLVVSALTMFLVGLSKRQNTLIRDPRTLDQTNTLELRKGG